MNRAPHQFWGAKSSAVEARLAKAVEEAANQTRAKVRAAKKYYNERFKDMSDEGRLAFVSSVESACTLDGYDRQLVECPACKNQALATGAIDWEWQVEQEYAGPDDYYDVPYPEVTFYPTDIRCNVCGLAIDGDTELEAAKIDLSWVLDDVDPQDFIPEDEEY